MQHFLPATWEICNNRTQFNNFGKLRLSRYELPVRWKLTSRKNGIVRSSGKTLLGLRHLQVFMWQGNCWQSATYRPTFPFEVWVMRFKLSKICKNRSKPWKCWLCWLASYECGLWKSRVLAPKFVLKFRCGHRLDSKRLGNRWFVSVSMVILVKASTILQYDMELSIGMGLGICILCISMHSRFHWEWPCTVLSYSSLSIVLRIVTKFDIAWVHPNFNTSSSRIYPHYFRRVRLKLKTELNIWTCRHLQDPKQALPLKQVVSQGQMVNGPAAFPWVSVQQACYMHPHL